MSGIKIYDRLYGVIEFTDEEMRFIRTGPIQRLKGLDISLPSDVLPTGRCATRFHHALGTAYLAKQVARRREYRAMRRELFCAALVHDAGHPPFCHGGEVILRRQWAVGHEDYVVQLIERSDFRDEMERQGCDVNLVEDLVLGQGDMPYRGLINGSLDLDNIDNTPRYGLSLDLIRERDCYDGLALAVSLQCDEQGLYMHRRMLPELQRWAQCRRKVYAYIESPEHRVVEAMLRRALCLAADQLEPNFCTLTDGEALAVLQNVSRHSRSLVRDALLWQYYVPVIVDNSPQFEDFPDEALLAELVSALGIEDRPEYICSWYGKNTGAKQIDIPLRDDQGRQARVELQSQATWSLQVFVHPSLADCGDIVRAVGRRFLKTATAG